MDGQGRPPLHRQIQLRRNDETADGQWPPLQNHFCGVSEMITFWNRYEVYMGFDMGKFNAVLDILADGKIRYKYRVRNNSPTHIGAAGMSQNQGGMSMYYVYVHKKDAEVADMLIHKHLR